jgi:hypothetical protein
MFSRIVNNVARKRTKATKEESVKFSQRRSWKGPTNSFLAECSKRENEEARKAGKNKNHLDADGMVSASA